LKDIHGQAIRDYYQGDDDATLIIHNSYDQPEEMHTEVFFREEEDLSTLEHLALIECKGRVLDIGAGSGVHSLILQSKGLDVVALENSPACVEVMVQSGVDQPLLGDFWQHHGKYDTILALMNGLGLAGTLAGVSDFLRKCMSLLSPDGQLLIDSSDISYLYEDGLQKPDGYYGEVHYQYEYKGEKGDWFDWVYVDQKTLAETCKKLGLKCEILHIEHTDQYLACITR